MPNRDEIDAVLDKARIVHTAGEVGAAIARMAAEATPALAEQRPVVLPIMMGGLFTAVQLCRDFRFAYELDYLHVGRYGRALEGGELVWSSRPRTDLSGRTVLLVDDVLDQGVTLGAVIDEIERLGAARTYVAVLAVKDLPAAEGRPHVDFAGVRCGDEYLFGCGMDYKGYWRGLSAIHAVTEPC